MAIDSATARYQVMALGRPTALLPVPDGTIGVDDRATLIGVYSFASLDTLVVAECTIITTRTMECTISITP